MAAKPKKRARKIGVNTPKKHRTNARSKANLKPAWPPGKSGNPAGRPKGSRNKLAEFVLADFCTLWEEGGLDTLKAVAISKPGTFATLAVALIPKQIELDARAAVYHIADRHLTADEWAAKWAGPDSMESPARPPKRPR